MSKFPGIAAYGAASWSGALAALLALGATSALGLDGFNVNSSTFTNQYNGNQIWNGATFLGDWSQAGGPATDALSLNGSNLVINNAASGLPAGNNGWIQQDSGASPWELGTGNWTVEISGKVNDTSAAADNFVLWTTVGGSRLVIRIAQDAVGYNEAGADLVSGVNNADAFHTFRVAFDAGDTTSGPNGTYHVWRDNAPISGVGVARVAADTTPRLIVGDCCSSIGNPVDPFEIQYVRYDMSGAYSPIAAQGRLELAINRNTGGMTLRNTTGEALANIIGYSILSSGGGLTQAGWDKQSSGSNLANDNDQWTTLSAGGNVNDLSEAVLSSTGADNGGDLAATSGTWNFGAIWRKSPLEDVQLQVLLDDGSILSNAASDLAIVYTGNNGAPFAAGDLDFDGDLDPADWGAFKSKFQGSNLAALGAPASHRAELYNLGDLTMDGAYSLADFQAFKTAYDAINGVGAFAAIPEPSTAVLLTLFGAAFMTIRRNAGNARRGALCGLALWVAGAGAAPKAWAQLPKLDSGAFTNKYNGNEIYNGTTFLNDWSQAGGATTAALSLNGANLVAANDANNGWLQQDSGASAWETGAGSYTLEIRAAIHNASPTVADGFVLWAERDGNRQVLWIQNDSVDRYNSTTGVQLQGGVDNTDGMHTYRLAYDAADLTAGAQGTYHVWRDGLKITGTGISRESGQTANRLIIGDCCTNLGNPVDPYEIAYVRFHPGAYQPQFAAELKLRVDVTSGAVSIVSDGSPINFNMNSYSITSGNSLRTNAWSSLEDQVVEGDPTPGNKDNGDSWEEFNNVSSAFIGEGFLSGATTVLGGSPLSLGNIFAPGSAQDLAFTYTATNGGLPAGGLMTGSVEYFVGSGFSADFDNDNDVDGFDLAKWKGDFGPTGGSDADNDGDSDGADFLAWQRQLGSSASVGAGAAVPEPAAAAMLVVCCGALLAARRTRRSRLGGCLAACCLLAAQAIPASADVFNDRHYSLGDLSNVGFDTQGVNLAAFPGAIDTGAYQDLIDNGSVTVVDVGPSGLKRPGLTSAANGALFDGVDDALTSAVSLNSPNHTWNTPAFFPTSLIPPDLVDDGQYDPPSATGQDGPDPDSSYTPAFPHNYQAIFSRGIQLWARPTGLGEARRQDLVVDSLQHGVFITADDAWGLQFDGPPSPARDNGSINSGVSVASTLDANGWAHVMELSGFDDPVGGGSAFGGALLVNGVAVVASNTFFDPDTTGFSIGGNQAHDNNFFTGAMDEVRVFLWGDNSDRDPDVNTVRGYLGGAHWGTLDLAEDNDWIKQKLASLGVTNRGDVDLNGVINAADATAFVSHWGKTFAVNDLQIGDWNSRQQGDLDYNGVVNLADAFIVHAALDAVGLSLNFELLSATVPEPATATLLIAGIAGARLVRGRRRVRRS